MTAKSTTKPKPTGRPTLFTQELADRICMELAQGKSLRTVVKNDWCVEGVTVWRWLREIESFNKQYVRAKQEAADAMAEDILDISDEELALGDDRHINNALVSRNRLRVDTRKWLMAKMKPKKYSERFELEDLPANAIVFMNNVPAPHDQSTNTGDLLPHEDPSDPDQTTD